MVKPQARRIKKQISQILLLGDKEKVFETLDQIPDKKLIGPLFTNLYSLNELVKFRSSYFIGRLAKRLLENNIEDARILFRRLMWNLNDESGGIGWGSPEAMGYILSQNKRLALEYESILFSYIDSGKNFIEHEMLQRGCLWGVGTYLKTCVEPEEKTIKNCCLFLNSKDPIKRGYALRALLNADKTNIKIVPKKNLSDKNKIFIFDGWNLIQTRIDKIIDKI